MFWNCVVKWRKEDNWYQINVHVPITLLSLISFKLRLKCRLWFKQLRNQKYNRVLSRYTIWRKRQRKIKTNILSSANLITIA